MTRTRGKMTSEARWRARFRVWSAVLFLVTGVALVRVACAAGAVEASIDAARIRERIHVERLASDRLQADMSTLMAPSRIRRIAGDTLKMREAARVRFITVPDLDRSPASLVAAKPRAVEGRSRPARLVSTIMDMAAGEAQVLLLGDVGLASAK